MLQNNSLEDYVESCIMLQYNNYYIRYFVGIFGHNIGHNRAKTVAMPNSILGGGNWHNPLVPNPRSEMTPGSFYTRVQ